MKTFLVVFSVVLLIFGLSIWYYRSAPGGSLGGDKSKTTAFQTGKTEASPSPTPAIPASQTLNQVLPSPTPTPTPTSTLTVTVKYLSLEIRQNQSGSLSLGQTKTLTAVAKEENGALVTISVYWSLSDLSLGDLSGTVGEEVKFTAKKSGKGKVVARFSNLTAEKDLVVVSSATSTGQVAGTVVSSSGTVAATTPAEIKALEIRLFDPSGRRFNVNDSRTYSARVFYSDNSEKTTDVSWSVDPSDLGSLDKTKGSQVTFTAKKSGSGNLRATFENLSASLYLLVN